MAKKKITEPAAPEEKPSKAALAANTELGQLLGGLEKYYFANTKAELEGFVNDTLEQIEEFKQYPKFRHQVKNCEILSDVFDKTNERDIDTLRTLAGEMITHLKDCLTQYNSEN